MSFQVCVAPKSWSKYTTHNTQHDNDTWSANLIEKRNKHNMYLQFETNLTILDNLCLAL